MKNNYTITSHDKIVYLHVITDFGSSYFSIWPIKISGEIWLILIHTNAKLLQYFRDPSSSYF